MNKVGPRKGTVNNKRGINQWTKRLGGMSAVSSKGPTTRGGKRNVAAVTVSAPRIAAASGPGQRYSGKNPVMTGGPQRTRNGPAKNPSKFSLGGLVDTVKARYRAGKAARKANDYADTRNRIARMAADRLASTDMTKSTSANLLKARKKSASSTAMSSLNAKSNATSLGKDRKNMGGLVKSYAGGLAKQTYRRARGAVKSTATKVANAARPKIKSASAKFASAKRRYAVRRETKREFKLGQKAQNASYKANVSFAKPDASRVKRPKVK